MRQPRRSAAVVRLAAAALAAILAAPPVAGGHGDPASLADWGNFGRRIASCQREIARAALLCGLRAWQARRSCREASLLGRMCDEEGTDAAIASARSQAIDSVAGACDALQVQNLRFVDLFEAQTDVIRFCRDTERAVAAEVFGAHDTPEPVAAPCRLAVAHAAGKLLRLAFRARTDALDRIAATPMRLQRKQRSLDRGAARIALARAVLHARIERECPEERIQAVYGQTLDAVLISIANQADCLASAAYAQGAVRCPDAVCGNGVIEPGEQCDDGNADPDDGCAGCFTTP